MIRLLCLGSCLAMSMVETNTSAKSVRLEDKNDLPVKTSSLSRRHNVKLRLSNGLQVWIVSDPDAPDESAAALAVNVGSWHDPDDYPGMAHFTEHLLFMGTTHYPQEDEFQEYCSKHGGTTNAYTACNSTVYTFTTQKNAFREGLHRFADFFIHPLFKEDGIERELTAVDEEHAKNLDSDGHRQWMLLKTLGNPRHNNRKFSTGTAETLRQIPREILIQWYRQHYSSDAMHLVIHTQHAAEDVAVWVEEYFSSIQTTPSEDLCYDALLSPKLYEHIVYQKPLRDLRQISLIWDVSEEYVKDNTYHTPSLLAYALNQKTKNSLYGILHDAGWIESLHAQYTRLGNKNGLFDITFHLTKKGVHAYQNVIDNCFQSIRFIQQEGVPVHLYEEYKTMHELTYQYQSHGRPFQFVTNHAHLLSECSEESFETFPRKKISPSAFNNRHLMNFSRTLTPNQSAIGFTVSPEMGQWIPQEKEKWYGTEYSVQPITSRTLEIWNSSPLPLTLDHPPVNEYVPQSITLLHEGKEKYFPESPTLLSDDLFGKCYFVPDTFYFVPHIDVQLALKSAAVDATPRSTVLLALLTLDCCRNSCATILSNARRASLKPSLFRDYGMLRFHVFGFSDRMDTFVDDFLHTMQQAPLSPEDFLAIKDELLSNYAGHAKASPFHRCVEELNHVFFHWCPTGATLYQELQNIDFTSFVSFKEAFFQHLYVEGLFSGNLDEKQAEALWQTCRCALAKETFPKEKHLSKSVFLLPKQKDVFHVEDHTMHQGNAAVLALQLGSYSPEKGAVEAILARAFHSAFFQQLRTKQQLGYIVQASPMQRENHLFFFMGAQSSTAKPEELFHHFEKFARHYGDNLEQMIPEESFEQYRSAILKSHLSPAKNLQGLANMFFSQAYEYGEHFTRRTEFCRALENLQYATFVMVSKKFLLGNNTRRLVVKITGSQNNGETALSSPMDTPLESTL